MSLMLVFNPYEVRLSGNTFKYKISTMFKKVEIASILHQLPQAKGFPKRFTPYRVWGRFNIMFNTGCLTPVSQLEIFFKLH